MNLNVIPFTEIAIYYQTTARTVSLPAFDGAITGELKNVKMFYERSSLPSFFTPEASDTQVVDVVGSVSTDVLYNGLDPHTDNHSYPGINHTYFSIDPDTVSFTFDEIFWEDRGIPATVIPYPMYGETGMGSVYQLLLAATEGIIGAEHRFGRKHMLMISGDGTAANPGIDANNRLIWG